MEEQIRKMILEGGWTDGEYATPEKITKLINDFLNWLEWEQDDFIPGFKEGYYTKMQDPIDMDSETFVTRNSVFLTFLKEKQNEKT
jgi:hypothetical protein